MKMNNFQDNSILEKTKRMGWELLTLSDVLIDETRKATKIKKRDYLESGNVPIIDQGATLIGGFSNLEAGYYDETPFIVFGDHTRILKYIEEPSFIGADGVKILKGKLQDKINIKYLYYFLKTVNIPDTGYNRHFKYLKEAIIPIPSLKIQVEIVNLLDKMNDIIGKRKQQIEDLSSLKKSTFLDMFGDPMNNKKSWEVMRFDTVINSLRYGISSPPIFSDIGHMFIRATNIKLGYITKKNMFYIDDAEAEKIKKCKLELGEIIFVRSGANSGDSAVVTKEYEGHYGAYDIIVNPNTELVNEYYLNVLFNSSYLEFVIKPLTRRAGQPHINADQIKSLPVQIPPIHLQNDFAEKVKIIDNQIEVLVQSKKDLLSLYNSLMQKAFNAELFTN